MTFKVGDIVTCSTFPDFGLGEILVQTSANTFGVRFEGYNNYDDDDMEDSDYPDLPDFHYCQTKYLKLHTESVPYDPEQEPSDETDI